MTLPQKKATVYYVDRDYDISFSDKKEKMNEDQSQGGCGMQHGKSSMSNVLYSLLIICIGVYAVYLSTGYAQTYNIIVRILVGIFAFLTNWVFIVTHAIVHMK